MIRDTRAIEVTPQGDPQTSSAVVARDALDQALTATPVITERNNVRKSNGASLGRPCSDGPARCQTDMGARHGTQAGGSRRVAYASVRLLEPVTAGSFGALGAVDLER